MNLSATEKELRQLLALVARWQEQKYSPDIEIDIALDRLRRLYETLLDAKHKENHCPPPHHATEQPAETPTGSSYDDQNEEPCHQSTSSTQEEHIGDISQVIDDISRWQEPKQSPCDIIIEDKQPEQPSETEQPEQGEQQIEQPSETEQQPEQDEQPSEQPTEQPVETEQPEQDEQPTKTPELHRSIDENLRRRFIHDLFCNDESFFIGEMRKIEALPSFDDVLIYIGQKYAWSPTNATAEEFVAMIASNFNQ